MYTLYCTAHHTFSILLLLFLLYFVYEDVRIEKIHFWAGSARRDDALWVYVFWMVSANRVSTCAFKCVKQTFRVSSPLFCDAAKSFVLFFFPFVLIKDERSQNFSRWRIDIVKATKNRKTNILKSFIHLWRRILLVNMKWLRM